MTTGKPTNTTEPAKSGLPDVAADDGESYRRTGALSVNKSTAALIGSAGEPSQGADAYSPATDARVKASGYQAPPVDTSKGANHNFATLHVIGEIR